MKLEVACDCGKRYRVKSDLVGKTIRCKECGGKVEVALGLAGEEAEAPGAEVEVKQKTKRAKPVTRSRARSTSPSREDAPAPRNGMLEGLRERALEVALGFAIGAVALFGLGMQENKLLSVARPDASPITCGELAASGPGKNAHVKLTDFILCPDYVYQFDERSKAWLRTYTPAVPAGSPDHAKLVRYYSATQGGKKLPFPRLENTPVMIKTALWDGHAVTNARAMEALCARDTLQGVVVNEIESVDARDARLLRDSYPGIDFKKCWILEVGRPVRSGSGFQGIGVLCAVGAIGMVLFRLRG